METSTRQLIEMMPYKVQERARYYLDYVSDRITDISMEEGVKDRLNEVIEEIEVVFVLRLLYGYFVNGYQNFQQTLEYLGTKEIDGFQIGSRVFSRQTGESESWQLIVTALENIVESELIGNFVRSQQPLDVIVRDLLTYLIDPDRDIKNGED